MTMRPTTLTGEPIYARREYLTADCLGVKGERVRVLGFDRENRNGDGWLIIRFVSDRRSCGMHASWILRQIGGAA